MHSDSELKTLDSEFHCFRRQVEKRSAAEPTCCASIEGLGKHSKEADLLSQLSLLVAETRGVLPSNEQR
jgi:hypothetical protein